MGNYAVGIIYSETFGFRRSHLEENCSMPMTLESLTLCSCSSDFNQEPLRYSDGESGFFLFLCVLPYQSHQLQQPPELSEVGVPFGIHLSASSSKGLPGRTPGLLRSDLGVRLMSLLMPKDTVQQSCSITKNSCLIRFIQICSRLFLTNKSVVDFSVMAKKGIPYGNM